jgi:ketosteroid isomerase-like protein
MGDSVYFSSSQDGNNRMTETEKVLLQNARFYEAVENGDLVTLEALWAAGNDVLCIHPGWDVLRGWQEIRASWENIFSSGEPIHFSLRNVEGRISGALGLVHLVEEISIGPNPALQVVRAITTNAFAFDGTSWRMVLHHASPVLANGDDQMQHWYN